MFINIPMLIAKLPMLAIRETVAGNCYHEERMDRREMFHQHGKTFTYSGPYCAGAAYIIRMDIINILLQVSEYIMPISRDDIYLGLCASLLGYRVQNLPGFSAHKVITPGSCMNESMVHSLVASGFTSVQLHITWISCNKIL